mgnify:CR=1 FL=1
MAANALHAMMATCAAWLNSRPTWFTTAIVGQDGPDAGTSLLDSKGKCLGRKIESTCLNSDVRSTVCLLMASNLLQKQRNFTAFERFSKAGRGFLFLIF